MLEYLGSLPIAKLWAREEARGSYYGLTKAKILHAAHPAVAIPAARASNRPAASETTGLAASEQPGAQS
jgi:hypothetical protein